MAFYIVYDRINLQVSGVYQDPLEAHKVAMDWELRDYDTDVIVLETPHPTSIYKDRRGQELVFVDHLFGTKLVLPALSHSIIDKGLEPR